MAGVFLSYDRDDTAAARVVATALERAGHSVWWDLHVRGGAQFAKVIEEALNAADAVVVLWSKDSVESAWVRDEAAAGRDSGRLIPATIDGTQAPLGFRQFQTIDLTDWKRGARSRGYKELRRTIEQDFGKAQSVPARHERPKSKRLYAGLVGALGIAAVLAGAYHFLTPFGSSAATPTVVVTSASDNMIAQELSRDLFAKLGVLQSSNSDALQLVDQRARTRSDLIFEVDASRDTGASKASLLLLSGKDRSLLWSGDYQQPSDKPGDLKQQLAYSAANVLECASEAYGPDGRALDDQTRKLYLKGCGDFSQVGEADPGSLTVTFRKVIDRAPKFKGAWARLLTAESDILFNPPFPLDDNPALRQVFEADIRSARKTDPDLPAAYIAEADMVAYARSLIQSTSLLDVAVQKNPNESSALSARALALSQVGRTKEAVNDARRAVQIQPFSARAQEGYISALTYAGEFEAAQQELSKANALFPGASNIAAARFRLNLRYGSAQDALMSLQRGDVPSYPGLETFLKARIDPTPRNVDAAIDAARRRMDGTPFTTADYIQTLAEFGRTEDLIDFLQRLPDPKQPGRLVGVLFRPAFHSFWRDRRAMQVAARFGLTDYWRGSGHWPDFCGWPDLPYDCKKEAAKLHA